MASYFPSNLGYIGIAAQTAKTTAKTTSKQFVRYLSESIGPVFDEQILREGGTGKYNVASVKTQHREEVGFSMHAYPKVTAYLLAALLGKDSVTNLTSTPKFHTITIKTTDLTTTPMQKWLTFNKMVTQGGASGDTYRAYGGKLNSITLTGDAGKPVVVAVEAAALTGKYVTTKETDTYQITQPFCFYNGTYRINALTTTTFDIKKFSLKLTAINDNGIQTTDLTRKDIINHRFDAEMTIELNYTDFTLWKKANYAAGTAPTSAFSDSGIKLTLATSASANLQSLDITIPKVRLKPHKITLDPSPKTLTQPLSGIAFKQATTQLITVVAKVAITTTMPY